MRFGGKVFDNVLYFRGLNITFNFKHSCEPIFAFVFEGALFTLA